MGESRHTLGVSVSFGKYENDALSWEKWSTFSPNKYLDEVGKCSTPGSVAQKKAFFEAHYKKIAALKAEAELQELQNSTQSDPSTSDDQIQHNSEQVQEVDDKDCTEEEIREKVSAVDNDRFEDESLQVGQNLVQSESPIVVKSCVDKLEEAVLVNDESMRLVKEHFNVDLDDKTGEGSKLEEAVLVNDESMKLVNQHFNVDSEAKTGEGSKEQVRKPKGQNVARQVKPSKVERNSLGMKKKEASLISKSPETPATRLTKTKPKASASASASATSSIKKPNVTQSSSSLSLSSSKNKTRLVSESRRVTPMSLNLSLSMNSVNSDTASSVTSRRRSLFMEQMGDKDIVKRAFKTFQNRVNQLPSSDTGPKQVATKASERKASTSMAHQKENERSRRSAEKIVPARSQGGPTWKSVSSGSLKGVGANERRRKAGPTSVTLTSDERAERRREFMKKLEEKSNAREAEKSQLSSKAKEVKDVDMKRPKQNLNVKAKPMPSFNRAQGASKSSSEKEATKTGTTRRPDPNR